MRDHTSIRRRDLCLAGSLLAGFRRQASGQTARGKEDVRKEDGFRPLFDGVSLNGWKRQPRSPGQTNLGVWTVEDGVIVGGQDPPGSGVGSYLVTEEKFADFELQIEARPDWRADTGILVRTNQQGNIGFQVLPLRHRSHEYAELDTAKMQAPGWDPKEVLQKVGPTGHIALEVHSNGPNDKLGKDRWAPGAVCRWRNISIKTL